MSSSRLLKKPDQCRSVATCAHVFWSGHYTQEDREVVEVRWGGREGRRRGRGEGGREGGKEGGTDKSIMQRKNVNGRLT